MATKRATKATPKRTRTSTARPKTKPKATPASAAKTAKANAKPASAAQRAKSKARAKPTPKRPATPLDAAAELARTVGTPRNINTVTVDRLACVQRWLTLDEPARVRVVDELTAALHALTQQPVFAEIRSYGWHHRPEFTTMVSLGKAIDRMIRPRLPLSEATLGALAQIMAQRSDLSARRLAAQLEHRAARDGVTFPLELAAAAIIKRYAWDQELVARLWAVIGPVVDRSVERADPIEAKLLADIGAGDAASLHVYADWLEERGDHRCAAFVRFVARPREARAAHEYEWLCTLVAPAWRTRVEHTPQG